MIFIEIPIAGVPIYSQTDKMEAHLVKNFVTKIHSLSSPKPKTKNYPIHNTEPRFEVCLFLEDAGIPYKVWTDIDVWRAHGIEYPEQVPGESYYESQVSDVHILVNNLERAETALEEFGYSRTRLRAYNQCCIGYGKGGRRRYIRLLKTTRVRSDCPEQPSQRLSQGIANVAAKLLPKRSVSEKVISGRGVFLMLAVDWYYELPNTLEPHHQPFPQLAEYCNSFISSWMGISSLGEPESTSEYLRLLYIADTLDVILYTNFLGTDEFEKGVWKQNRQVLYELMRLRWSNNSLSKFLVFTPRFHADSMATRNAIVTGSREPVLPNGVRRESPERMPFASLPQDKPNEAQFRRKLPRLTWLVSESNKDSWWLLSLNMVRVFRNKKRLHDAEVFNKRCGRRPRCLSSTDTPKSFWMGGYKGRKPRFNRINWNSY